MALLIIKSLINTIKFLIITFAIILILNYLFNKDFKKLIKQIKKIALSNRKNKTKAIQQKLYNYFFIEE